MTGGKNLGEVLESTTELDLENMMSSQWVLGIDLPQALERGASVQYKQEGTRVPHGTATQVGVKSSKGLEIKLIKNNTDFVQNYSTLFIFDQD